MLAAVYVCVDNSCFGLRCNVFCSKPELRYNLHIVGVIDHRLSHEGAHVLSVPCIQNPAKKRKYVKVCK